MHGNGWLCGTHAEKFRLTLAAIKQNARDFRGFIVINLQESRCLFKIYTRNYHFRANDSGKTMATYSGIDWLTFLRNEYRNSHHSHCHQKKVFAVYICVFSPPKPPTHVYALVLLLFRLLGFQKLYFCKMHELKMRTNEYFEWAWVLFSLLLLLLFVSCVSRILF